MRSVVKLPQAGEAGCSAGDPAPTNTVTARARQNPLLCLLDCQFLDVPNANAAVDYRIGNLGKLRKLACCAQSRSATNPFGMMLHFEIERSELYMRYAVS
jgi:hypothetical protein